MMIPKCSISPVGLIRGEIHQIHCSLMTLYYGSPYLCFAGRLNMTTSRIRLCHCVVLECLVPSSCEISGVVPLCHCPLLLGYCVCLLYHSTRKMIMMRRRRRSITSTPYGSCPAQRTFSTKLALLEREYYVLSLPS